MKIRNPTNRILRTISDFLHKEVKEYSIHVVKERALPSVVDGFKPSARKVIYTADKVYKSYKRTVSLVGDSISIGNYDKGDGALPGIIVNLTQDFPGANNVPYLQGEGEFGTRQSPDGFAAPRYTKIKVHPNFDKFFTDKFLHEYENLQEQFEPKFFLPSIPTILLNHTEGIAVGFACEFQPYNITDIIKNVKRCLKNKTMKKMTPYYEGFKGTIHEIDSRWTMDGILNKTTKSKWSIKEIPIGISREKYVNHLEFLVESKTIIEYIEKEDDNIEFDLILSRDQFSALEALPEEKLLKKFKLRIHLNENLNCISENNALLQFNNVLDIIQHFVDYRLTVLTRRKEYMVDLLMSKVELNSAKQKFVELVLSGHISLKGLVSKIDLKKRILTANKLFGPYVDDCMSIPVYNITREYVNQTISTIKELKKEMDYFADTSEEDLFEEDLKTL